MTNFDFLKKDKKFSSFADVAVTAEKLYRIDIASCIFNIRRAAEFAVKWMYSVDGSLVMPYQDNFVTLINTIEFKDIVGNDIFRRIDFIRLVGNSRFMELFGDPVLNPYNWETKPFLETGTCKNGMNFHYDDSGVELNCLGVGDFKNFSIIDDTSVLPMVSLNEMPSAEYLLQDGDIVFVRSNGNKALVGRSVAVYPKNTPTTFSGFCIRYRKLDDAVTIPYLLRVLKSNSIRKQMMGRGANIQNLNQQILSAIVIPIPPIDLQNQFATFVEQTDKLKFEVKESLEKLEILKKSLMQKYFG